MTPAEAKDAAIIEIIETFRAAINDSHTSSEDDVAQCVAALRALDVPAVAVGSDARSLVPGAVVRLKSGGPPMTLIRWLPGDEVAHCSCFLSTGPLEGYFARNVLVVVR
ncbi:MAG TPA: hypothetical protein VH374_26325 [Polyangia bacterium]|nr:hypothetical protein [Polyangia bacterium]